MIEHINVVTAAGSFDALAAGEEGNRPVLLLHGFPQTASVWSHQLEALAAAGYRAVAPDQRGYSPGVRPEAVEEYRMELLVGDVLAIAEGCGWTSFDLVGHDWGAAVAWVVAGEHPDRVRTLTAVSTPHPAPFSQALREDQDQQQRSAYFQLFRQEGEAENRLLAHNAQALRQVYGSGVPRSRVADYVARLSEPGALTAALNWYRAMRLRDSLGRITVPTMYVWSTEDLALGPTAALATTDWVEGPYQFEILEGVSHWIPEEAAETLSSLLLQHLAAHAR